MESAITEFLAQAASRSVGPGQWIGVALAVVGAALMSISAMLQHRGVDRVSADTREASGGGLGGGQLLALLRQPVWLAGTGLIGIAIAFQLAALAFAPLVVVQPLGVISLVITTLITARQRGTRLRGRRLVAVILSVLGIAAFVTVAAVFAVESPITPRELATVLIILAVLVVLLAIGFVALRRTRYRSLYYIVAGGALYGFVATLARVVIVRVREGDFGVLSVLCAIGLVLALAVGSYFVQTAYATGSPDLVVAGLTVIDPLVAVAIGIIVLGETAGAPWWALALFVAFGAVSALGVWLLETSEAREHHTEMRLPDGLTSDSRGG